jgi:hypothetical protein
MWASPPYSIGFAALSIVPRTAVAADRPALDLAPLAPGLQVAGRHSIPEQQMPVRSDFWPGRQASAQYGRHAG